MQYLIDIIVVIVLSSVSIATGQQKDGFILRIDPDAADLGIWIGEKASPLNLSDIGGGTHTLEFSTKDHELVSGKSDFRTRVGTAYHCAIQIFRSSLFRGRSSYLFKGIDVSVLVCVPTAAPGVRFGVCGKGDQSSIQASFLPQAGRFDGWITPLVPLVFRYTVIQRSRAATLQCPINSPWLTTNACLCNAEVGQM